MRSLRDETKFHQMWRGPIHRRAADDHKMRIGRGGDRHRVAGAKDQQTPGFKSVAGNIEHTVDDIDGTFFVAGIERQRRARL